MFLLEQQHTELSVLLCRHPSQWAGAMFMAQHENAALFEDCEEAELLRNLELDRIYFACPHITLPRMLESAAFRDVCSVSIVKLDQCRCATVAVGRKHGAGQQSVSVLFRGLDCAFLQSMLRQQTMLPGRLECAFLVAAQ